MKKLFLILCLAGAACGVAQAQKTPKVVTVNVETVMTGYQKAIDFNSGIRAELQGQQQKLEAKGKELEALRAEIERLQKDSEIPMNSEQQKATLRASASAKAAVFQREQNEFLRYRQQLETTYQTRGQVHTRDVLEDLRKVVDAVAKEKGADLVLSSSFSPTGVLFASPSFDVSDEVLKRLNAAYAASTTVPGVTPPATAPVSKP